MDTTLSRGYMQLPPDTPKSIVRQPMGQGDASSGRTSTPRDRCSLVYLGLVLCGAGFLLPYNSFITAVDFYQERYPNSTVIFDISLIYILTAFVSVLMNNLLVEALSLQARITFGYVISFVMLLTVAVTDIWYNLFSPSVSYSITLLAVAVIALGCTVQQSSFYGYTSMLPRRYTQAVMVGESAAGLLVSINRIFTKALLPTSPRVNTSIFFAISIGIIFACCVIFHVLCRTRFTHYHVTQCQTAGIADDQKGIMFQNPPPEEVSLVDILDGNVTRDSRSYGVLILQSPGSTPPASGGTESLDGSMSPSPLYPACRPSSGRNAASSMDHSSLATHATSAPGSETYKTGGRSRWQAVKDGVYIRYQVARQIWQYMLSIGLAYFVTLCLFPGIESEVVSCRLGSWMPVLLISTFNLADFIGKIVSSIEYPWPRGRLVSCTVLRVVLIPLLMMCAAPRNNPLISGEGWALLFSACLGLSNGYFGSVPMILAPGSVPDEHKELTGNMMTLSYSIGLTTGSCLAYALDQLLGHHITPASDPCAFTYNATYPGAGYPMAGNGSSGLEILVELPSTDLFPG